MNSKMKNAKQKGSGFILYKGRSEEVNKRKILSFLYVSIKTKQKFEEDPKNVSQTNS
jgi:hypothetical protein